MNRNPLAPESLAEMAYFWASHRAHELQREMAVRNLTRRHFASATIKPATFHGNNLLKESVKQGELLERDQNQELARCLEVMEHLEPLFARRKDQDLHAFGEAMAELFRNRVG